MPTSTLTSKGQTTVPKEVREALDLETGDKLTWEIRGGKVAVTTERPAFYRWEGIIKNSSGDVVKEIEEARKRRGRVNGAAGSGRRQRLHIFSLLSKLAS